VVKVIRKKKKETRTASGRLIFPEKMRLWALIQSDDSSQWIAATVKAQSRHEATWMFNKHFGYPQKGKLLDGFCLTGTNRDKYLQLVELGGLDLPCVMEMKPHEVKIVQGLYELE